MDTPVHSPADLRQLYRTRFAGKTAYRLSVWTELCRFFSRWISEDDAVLDLGCGYCEFINSVECGTKFAMDLNPDVADLVKPNIRVLFQDCSQPWDLPPESLDVVFTSNFFEHLPTKTALENTLVQVFRALRPGGRLIAMGPNIKYLASQYWDFFDHYLPLTELALSEVLTKRGFRVETCWDRFLPYTMSDGRRYPIQMLQAYLAAPPLWKLVGKQFLVMAEKP